LYKNKAQWLRIPRTRRKFYTRLSKGTSHQVSEFLTDLDVEMTDEIQQTFKRLDLFLGEGKYINIAGEHILTFPNPKA